LVDGEDGDAEPGADHPPYGRDFAALERDSGGEPGLAAQAVTDLAQTCLRAESHEGLGRNLRKVYPAPVGEAMIRRNGQAEPFVDEYIPVCGLVQPGFRAGYRQVNLALVEHVGEVFGCCLAKHELDAWFEGAERPDEIGYQPGPQRGQESDADGAGVRVRQSGQLAFSCVELTDDPLGEADQDPSELVEPDPVPGAVEQLHAQLVLQAAEAPRDRRLAQMEPSRRSCHVLGLRYRQEHPEIVDADAGVAHAEIVLHRERNLIGRIILAG
jgi:hypothetical protein